MAIQPKTGVASKTLRVLLADDHPVVLDGIQRLVGTQEDMVVVGLAHDGQQAVDLALELQPDVVVLDISMPRANGIVAANRIHADHPRVAVIALSVHASQQMVDDALAAGVSGYVTKRCPTAELVHAIRKVAAGGTYMSSDLPPRGPAQGRRASGRPPGRLSLRECEVLQHIAEGMSTKQIAATLGLSEHTVNRHRVRIMDRLHRRTVAELTKYAVKEGLSPLD